MRDWKIVWVASMPRAGSMWTYNIVRAMLAEVGLTVLPRQVPKLEAQVLAETRPALADRDPGRRWALKTHHPIAPDIPKSLFICPVRDVRDAMISGMRFMHMGFPRALACAEAWTRLVDYYRANLPADCVLPIDYREIAGAPDHVARVVGEFLGLELTEDQRTTIVARFAKSNVQARVQRLQTETVRAAAEGRADSQRLVSNPDGSLRYFDPETGFQSGHVSDYRDGDWARLLPAGALGLVERRLGPWLARNGYPSTLEAAPA